MSHWKSCLKSKPLVAAPLNVRHQLSALAILESPVTSQHPSPIALSGSATPRVSLSTPTSTFTHQLNPLPPLFAHLPSLNIPDCPGFIVSVDRVFERYPLARHQGGDVGWIPVHIGDNGRDITVKHTQKTTVLMSARHASIIMQDSHKTSTARRHGLPPTHAQIIQCTVRFVLPASTSS
jgi:hypothetical protein